jgi:DNA-binding response OmpR family regulator
MDVLNIEKSLRILVVEDNADIAENIGDYLEEQGHLIDFALDGISGMHLVQVNEYDIIVLDIVLPGMDGLSLCRKFRSEHGKSTPILMLTARDTLTDKLAGFDAGADDYLVKPFALEELEVRLLALIRRTGELAKPKLQVADLVINTGSMQVRRSGRPIDLTRTGLKILTLLMKAHPNVVLRTELENAMWGDIPPGSDALRSHIYTLRRAIDKPFRTPLLETVHGIGYRLAEPHEISA